LTRCYRRARCLRALDGFAGIDRTQRRWAESVVRNTETVCRPTHLCMVRTPRHWPPS
jgi:hypothetical protein